MYPSPAPSPSQTLTLTQGDGSPGQVLSGGCLCEPLCLPVHKEAIEVSPSLSWAKPFAQVPHFVFTQTLGDEHQSKPTLQMQKLRLKARKWKIQDANLPHRISSLCAREVEEVTALWGSPGPAASERRAGLQL